MRDQPPAAFVSESEVPPMTILARLVAVALLAALAAVAAFLYYAPAHDQPVALEVKPGATVRSVARELAQQRVIVAAEPFVWLTRLAKKDGTVKAGSYEFDEPLAPLAVLDMLTAGDDTQLAVTIVEGWTFEQM